MQLSDFIDIHTHILPGFDDGPARPDASLALAGCYTRAGIGKVFATPHFLSGTAWSATPEKIVAGVRKLQDFLDQAGSDLTVIPGMEIALQKHMGEKLDKGCYLPLGSSNSYLLEPPFTPVGFDLADPINEFIEREVQVILAHPERSEYLQRYPEILGELHARGVAIQVNIGSLLGWFGSQSQKTAARLLEWKIIDFIASDAHSAEQRRPPAAPEWEQLQDMLSPADLQRLASTNPAKLI